MASLNFGYKDELLATGLVLGLTVIGSFLFANQFMDATQGDEVVQIRTVSEERVTLTPNPTQLALGITDGSQVLGLQNPSLVTPTPAAGFGQAIPTPNYAFTDVTFGYGGLYDFPEYKLELSSPRIRINTSTPSSRVFVVDVVLTNRAVSQGIANRMDARVVKDGAVVAEGAVMNVTPLGIVPIGATVNFQATISLIEGTDVDQLLFVPDGLSPVEHLLNP